MIGLYISDESGINIVYLTMNNLLYDLVVNAQENISQTSLTAMIEHGNYIDNSFIFFFFPIMDKITNYIMIAFYLIASLVWIHLGLNHAICHKDEIKDTVIADNTENKETQELKDYTKRLYYAIADDCQHTLYQWYNYMLWGTQLVDISKPWAIMFQIDETLFTGRREKILCLSDEYIKKHKIVE